VRCKATNAKPLTGYKGASVLEITDDFDGNTYRAVYIVKFHEIVYILHAFQKKSKKGIATPTNHIQLIEQRLKKRRNTMTNITHDNDDEFVTTTHPFEGLKNGEERLAKAQLARQINALIKERRLKQKPASELLGVTQPEISQIANGRLSGFSFDRLYRCLHALDMDVEITIKKHVPVGNETAGIHVSSLQV